MKATPVGHDRLRAWYPALFVSHVLGEERAAELFAPGSIVERAKAAAGRGMEPAVAAALRRYNEDCGAPAETRAALDRLERGAAVVVTGQQPSVGWGPLYNFYKAATAIRRAREVEAAGVPCAALFWNHSDDARGGGSVAFPDREGRVREVALPWAEEGRVLYEAGTDDALRLFAGGLAAALPATPFRDGVEEALRGAHRGSVAESFTRMLLGALGRFGLVVVEPRHLEGERAARFFAEHLAKPERLARAVEAGRERVLARGFEDHLGREVGLDLFEVRGGRRTRVERPGPVAGRLSAGVALRPLLQDAVLPTCAYVGGPSEVGYQAELREAYEAFGLAQPAVLPRATATLIGAREVKAMARHGLGEADLFLPEAELAGRVAGGAGEEDPAAGLGALAERLGREVEAALAPFGEDPALARAREKTAAKIREALDAMAGRVREALGRREETGRGRWARLALHLRPGGKLQERVFTPLYYEALHGPGLLPGLLGALDARAHQVIDIS